MDNCPNVYAWASTPDTSPPKIHCIITKSSIVPLVKRRSLPSPFLPWCRTCWIIKASKRAMQRVAAIAEKVLQASKRKALTVSSCAPCGPPRPLLQCLECCSPSDRALSDRHCASGQPSTPCSLQHHALARSQCGPKSGTTNVWLEGKPGRSNRQVQAL